MSLALFSHKNLSILSLPDTTSEKQTRWFFAHRPVRFAHRASINYSLCYGGTPRVPHSFLKACFEEWVPDERIKTPPFQIFDQNGLSSNTLSPPCKSESPKQPTPSTKPNNRRLLPGRPFDPRDTNLAVQPLFQTGGILSKRQKAAPQGALLPFTIW